MLTAHETTDDRYICALNVQGLSLLLGHLFIVVLNMREGCFMSDFCLRATDRCAGQFPSASFLNVIRTDDDCSGHYVV